MQIRPANTQDLYEVKKCAQNAYDIYVHRIGTKPPPMVADFGTLIADGTVYVLVSPEEIKTDQTASDIIGFIVFYPRDDHLHIENVAIHPHAQGNGHGRTLIKFAEDHAIKAGLNAVELYTNQKMTENITYYPSIGYHEIDRRTEEGLDRAFFRKEL